MGEEGDRSILHYRVVRKLGEGGMGTVYLAVDTKLDRRVALKFLVAGKTATDDARERLLREARAASRLSDSNILTIFAVEHADEGDFIAMEYLEGCTLRDHALANELSVKQALDLAIPIAEGLAAAHEQGVVHRDVKPDNVLVGVDGRVKVMDFGLSKIEDATRITQEGAAVGTLAYMSPEQARAQDLDARTDVFSYGVMLYELLARRSPFHAASSTPATAIQAILNETPEPLARYKADVPASLQALLEKALEKDREYRYQSMRDVLADLRRVRREMESGSVVLSGVAPAPPAPSSDRALQPATADAPAVAAARRRSPWPYLVAAVLALVVVSPFFRSQPPESPAGGDGPTTGTAAAVPDGEPAPEKGSLVASKKTPLDEPKPKSGRSRYIAIVGGSAREPTFSPDGSQIAFVMDDDDGVAQVWLKSLAEGDPLQLTQGDKDKASPAWSPTGSLIAFVRDEGALPQMPMLHRWSIWVAAPPTGKPRRIVEMGEQPRWTPDGKEVLYESFTVGVAAHHMETGETRAIKAIPRNQMPFAAARCKPSPDGSMLAYFRPELGPAGDLWVVPAEGGEPRRLTHDVTTGVGFDWAPDGQGLAYSSSRAGSTTLWYVPLEGGPVEPITTGVGEDTEPEYSADGKKLIFTNARHTYRLKTLDPATGKARTLYEDRNGMSFSEFSPDGSQIAFCAAESNGFHVHTIGSDGKGLVKRTSGDGGMFIFPQWGPGGRSIYCYRRVDDAEDYVRIDLDTGKQAVVRKGWTAHKQVWLKVSPDGKRLLYMRIVDMQTIPKLIIEDIESGEQTELKMPLFDPRWSPDGKRAVGFNFMGFVTILDFESGLSKTIERGFGQEWSPDGKSVYFAVQKGEEYALRRSSADARKKDDVAHLGPMEAFNLQIDVAPNGHVTWIEFVEGKTEMWLLEFE